ncbi:MAG TPA: hypothetical protein DGG95_04940 [Cytophagales bacterium]|jgi:hypothetical protein|nr:hypothetical protein [Cytophagales bacterium]
MKNTLLKYSFALLATLLVVGIYHFINIRLFNLDILQKTREHYFKLTNSSRYVDESIVLLNSGTMEADELGEKIDSLLACHPAVIGLIPCHLQGDINQLKATYRNNKKVVIANCSYENGSLSRLINEGNSVTRFAHDNENYFEFKVDFAANSAFHQRKIKERKNENELINYFNPRKSFYRHELNNIILEIT